MGKQKEAETKTQKCLKSFIRTQKIMKSSYEHLKRLFFHFSTCRKNENNFHRKNFLLTKKSFFPQNLNLNSHLNALFGYLMHLYSDLRLTKLSRYGSRG
jgi:hypothetical protein